MGGFSSVGASQVPLFGLAFWEGWSLVASDTGPACLAPTSQGPPVPTLQGQREKDLQVGPE
jgi:hypothetical protein